MAEIFFSKIEEKYIKNKIYHSYSKEIVFIEDYAFLINAIIDLAEKTMNFKYKDLAKRISIEALSKFYLKRKIFFKKTQKKIMMFFLIQLISVIILYQTEMLSC